MAFSRGQPAHTTTRVSRPGIVEVGKASLTRCKHSSQTFEKAVPGSGSNPSVLSPVEVDKQLDSLAKELVKLARQESLRMALPVQQRKFRSYSAPKMPLPNLSVCCQSLDDAALPLSKFAI
jgi:hypothetical protein